MNDQEYRQLTQKVMTLTGIDLDSYKSQQMRRRLDAYVANQAAGVSAYCSMLEQDRNIVRRLRDFITINVSEFFRDKEQFEAVQTTIIPGLLRRNRCLNIWSAACSHGAEPYSLAIILDEVAPGPGHRILATDIDEAVLARAKAGGPYPAADIRNVDKARLLKYFTKSDKGYLIDDRIRRKVELRQLNLLRDPFEAGFDLIVCRNVVIYFSDKAKAELMRRFHRSLKDDGLLFMGATETLVAMPDSGFERTDKCFYKKRSVGTARPAFINAA